MRIKKHNPKLTYKSRELRKNMTPQEKHLWYDYLRTYPINFLKQKVIDDYIVDFYCSKAKLAIEIDGDYHNYQKQEKERIRTQQISKHNILLIRIPNSYIDSNFSECCEFIDKTVKRRIGN